jgi:hypothetical protein
LRPYLKNKIQTKELEMVQVGSIPHTAKKKKRKKEKEKGFITFDLMI